MKNISVAAIILAAGKGTRMGHELPKPLYPIVGKPMVHYTLDTIRRIPLTNIYVVVGFRAIDIKMSLGKQVTYVNQTKQRGTGHALQCAVATLPPSIKTVIVLNGDDSAFFETSTLRKFLKYHQEQSATISLFTHQAIDPTGLGRIVRDKQGNITKIVEEAEATTAEKNNKEVNTGCYIINTDWVKENFKHLSLSPKNELYITDLIEIAYNAKQKIASFTLSNPSEWSGVNTKNQLLAAHQTMVKKLKKMNSQTTSFVDIDITILDTDRLKKDIPEKIHSALQTANSITMPKDKFLVIYQKLYQQVKQNFGYVNIPELCDLLAAEISPSQVDLIKTTFFSMPFKQYLRPGAIELLELLHRWSRVIFFCDGDLVFEPVKINNLGLSDLCHEIHVSEKKSTLLKDLLNIYDSENIVVIDDQIAALELFAAEGVKQNLIWIKQGSYQHIPPQNKNFKPDHTATSLPEITEYLQKKVFSWT